MPAAVGTGLTNYVIDYVDGSLTVELAPLTITADDQSKPFGVAFTFDGTEFTTSGLRNADTVDSATLSSAGAPALAAPGSYPIDVSAAIGTGLDNYAIDYVEGTLTVGNTTPVVGDASVSTDAMQPVSGAVTVSDPDTGQTLTVTLGSGPANGTATVAGDGSFAYTPTGTFTGSDSFTIEACDDDTVPACGTGTVTVAVHPVAVDDDDVTLEGRTVEIDVQANDIGDAGAPEIVDGPEHGTAVVGSIIYTPDAGFTGIDRVVYRVCSPSDPQVCDEATVSITVEADGLPSTAARSLPPSAAGPAAPSSLPLALLVFVLVAGAGALTWLASRRPRRARGARR